MVQNPHENTMTADYVMKKSFWYSSSSSPLMKHKSPLVICSLLIGQYGINWYRIRESESLYFNNLWISFYRHLCRNWCVIFDTRCFLIYDLHWKNTLQRLLMTMDNHISLNSQCCRWHSVQLIEFGTVMTIQLKSMGS